MSESDDDNDEEELFFACEDGDAKWLIEILETDGGVDNIDPIDDDGLSPLMLATNNGCKEVVDILLKHKADPNLVSTAGVNALFLAVHGGYVDCVKQLIKHKGNVNHKMSLGIPTPLYYASQNGDASIAKILVEAKAEVDTTVNGTTPLFVASQRGRKGCVSILLNAGANCNLGNSYQASPLFIAVQKKRNDICQQLLGNSRIKVDNPTRDGTTPLLISIQLGNLDEMELVIKAGADIERADDAGRTPLLTAANYGDLEAIEILVQNGVDLGKAGPDGRTAHTILKEEFSEDLGKIAARNRRMKDLKSLHSSYRPKLPRAQRDTKHDLNERIYSKAANLFAQHDVDNDKTLEKKELREILVTLGCEEKLGAKKFDDLMTHSFDKFDKDNDGSLDFQEFLRLYTMLMGSYKKSKRDNKKQQAAKNETGVTTIKLVSAPIKSQASSAGMTLRKPKRPTGRAARQEDMNERIYSKAANLFAQYDVDNDKTLGKIELRQILVTLGCEEKLGAKKLDNLMTHSFSKFDKDNDGSLDFQEFLRLYNMLMGNYKKSARTTKNDAKGALPAAPHKGGKYQSKTVPPPPIHKGKSSAPPPPPAPRKSAARKSGPRKRLRMSHVLQIVKTMPASQNAAGASNDLKLPSIDNKKHNIRW